MSIKGHHRRLPRPQAHHRRRRLPPPQEHHRRRPHHQKLLKRDKGIVMSLSRKW